MGTLPADRRLLSTRSRSRPGNSRNPSVNSVPYLPHVPNALTLAEGPVSQEAVGLLQDYVHPRRRAVGQKPTEDTVANAETAPFLGGQSVGSDGGETEGGSDGQDWETKQRPWYRRASPWWYVYH